MQIIIQRWRSQALSVLADPNSKRSLRVTAERFLAQWGV
jgi:hypothetical protein